MELSHTTVELLRDEAYAFLCGEAVTDGLERLAKEFAGLAGGRPNLKSRFGPDGSNTMDRPGHEIIEQDAALRNRLGRLSLLERRLQVLLHPELHAFLMQSGADYVRFARAHELLQQWEDLHGGLTERLAAFALELRLILQETTATGSRPDLGRFVALREAAANLDQHFAKLADVDLQLSTAMGAGGGISVPALPNFQHAAWVGRIYLLPAPQLAAEAARVETEVRQFLAQDQGAFHTHLEASHEACRCAAENFLQGYWNQLRTHAQVYYVEERDMDEVIEELEQRYLQPAAGGNPLRAR